MTIDLEKKLNLRKQLIFDLSKQKGIENQKAQVVLCLDYSGSMSRLYSSGFVQEVLERIVPVAMQFDDNGEMELYLFHNKCFRQPKNVSVKNVVDYIAREIRGDMGGTSYAPTIDQIVKENCHTGFFGGKKAMDLPVYVIFITDGDNDDHTKSEAAIKQASNHGIFFQFIGIGAAYFNFLQKLDNLPGRTLDNANFFPIQDLNAMSDNDLYSKLLGEFPEWLPQARKAGMIK